MPLPAFVPSFLRNLRVAYRASSEPHQLHVELTLGVPDPTAAAVARVRDLVSAINMGAAADSHFPPWAAAAQITSGPVPSLNPAEWFAGPVYRWVLAVQGISPRFLRSFVEVLSLGTAHAEPRALVLHGSFQMDATAMSVDEEHLSCWSLDDDCYPDRWPELPFTVHTSTIPRGCALRIQFGRQAGPNDVERMNEVLGVWGILSTTYPNIAGDGSGYRSFIDRLGVCWTEYSRFIEEFDVRQRTASTTLLHMLARFSKETASIVHVDLRMP